MSPKIIMTIIFLFLVPQPRNQNQQDCRDTEAQLGTCRKKLADCQQDLNQANGDCEAKLQQQRKQADVQYAQLKGEYVKTDGDLRKCQGDYNQIKINLTKVQNDLVVAQGKINVLQGDYDGSMAAANKLRSENAGQKAAYETQLAEKQSVIDAKTSEVGDKNTELSNKTKEIARLNSLNVSLAADVSKLGLSLKSVEQAKIAAEQAKSDLARNLAVLTDEQRKNPEVVLALVKDHQTKMDQSGAPASITQGKDGSLKRELVIGTLEVKPYPSEISLEGKLQLIAIFTPRPLPGVISGETPWYVSLVYNPPSGIKAPYSQDQSLGEQVREVRIGTDHKWVWLVDAANSQGALSETELDILAGFQKDKVERIAGQRVVLTREKPKPGWFASLFATVKENLTYILASIMTLLGIWAAYLNVKLRRVEVEKTNKVEAPQP